MFCFQSMCALKKSHTIWHMKRGLFKTTREQKVVVKNVKNLKSVRGREKA